MTSRPPPSAPRPPDDPSKSTQHLVRRARGGDDAALESLLDHAAPRVRAQVRRRLGRDLRAHVESGDLAQEVLLETARSVPRLPRRGGGSFWRWVAAVVENRIRLAARRARRKPLLPPGPRLSPDLYVEDAPTARANRAEPDGRVLREIDRLTPDHREVLRLRHLEELPFAEIARRMRRTERAVWMLHKRATVALAERLLPPSGE